MNGKILTLSRGAFAGKFPQAAAALLFLLTLCGVPCRAQTAASADLDKCIMGVDGNPDEVLKACTAAIESGLLSETNRRAAFNDRGIAHRNKDDFDSAIADFNMALEINPNDDKVLNNRGAAYMYKGDNDRA